MESLNAGFVLGGALLALIGIVMILRRAFMISVWWGVGCVMVPILIPIFAILKWPETKKGFIALMIGAISLSGVYFVEQRDANRAIAQIKISKITVTTALDDTHLPVSDLSVISMNEKKVFLHIKMEIPPNKFYRFTGQLYDAGGKLVLNYSMPVTPRESNWNTWFYHNFDSAINVPGEWRFDFLVNGKKLAEQPFQVSL